MRTSVVVTSVSAPTKSMVELSKNVLLHGFKFMCIGDQKSPEQYQLQGCKFFSLNEQKDLGFELANYCPVNHYSRKNIGYLCAMQEGSLRIIETDDDNYPLEGFGLESPPEIEGRLVRFNGWVNVYSFFTDQMIWPRGFPLEFLQCDISNITIKEGVLLYCPVQQGLADGNPDVDGVYRLTRKLPFKFEKNNPVILWEGSWSPFNSQNTIWFKPAFPLMYLPSHCNFRMTDIWRSFVCQACMWPNNWYVAFHEPTVFQYRNEHNLLLDFKDEIPGYLYNNKIVEAFSQLSLTTGTDNIFRNMVYCYEVLISMGFVGPEELSLLNVWERDLAKIGIIH